MKLMLSMLLLAASGSTELIDEIQTVSAGDWAFRDVQLHRQAARIAASFEVLDGPGVIQMALMPRDDVERISDDFSGAIAATSKTHMGVVIDRIRRRGDYAIVLDNSDGKQPVKVHLRVWLDFNGPEVKSLPPDRQAAVVVISCAVFIAIVGFSARQLWKGMRG